MTFSAEPHSVHTGAVVFQTEAGATPLPLTLLVALSAVLLAAPVAVLLAALLAAEVLAPPCAPDNKSS